ncbi:hypothetical protein FAF44_52835 [Nonomuraea sp. MG754425]|uniref:hypothetical protein n=1 Tax=Nonomuraea sp. MG754425 TaxID=2570319 RepID=UPI001F26581B|nr:hypothetical protein [Nonomuraea sp. MG754425]MCF6476939.1 hypothetical protein [Nonomuraea sp. MG754425]
MMAAIRDKMTMTHEAFLERLRRMAQHRHERWDTVPGLYGPEPGWVLDEAEQMLAYVNELGSQNGLPAATVQEVLRIESSAAGHCDYLDKYALRCAFLALGM